MVANKSHFRAYFKKKTVSRVPGSGLRHYLVIRLGFEPKTHSLEGCCSIQLSYRTVNCPDASGKVLQSYIFLFSEQKNAEKYVARITPRFQAVVWT